MSAGVPPPIPSDPGLPGARGLLTGDGHAAVKTFLSERGWTTEDVRPVQAMYRPARSCAVRYRIVASSPGGRRSFSVCAESRAREGTPVPPPDEERAGLTDPVSRAGPYLVWAFPYDPSLPGLPEAAWGPAAARHLEATAVSVQPLRYRPRRRAVFRYRVLRRTRGGTRWETRFGKVLPRSKAERARSAVGAWGGDATGVRLAMPSGSLGEHAFVFEPARGTSLRDLLLRGGPLPSPARVASIPETLAAQIPAGELGLSARRQLAPDAAATAAALVERLVPSASGDARRVVEAVAAGADRGPLPPRTVHGDLYEAQVFVDDDYGLGLIDLDDFGPGDPVADAANFCGHLLVLALSAPAAAKRLVAYRDLVRRAFLDRLGVVPSDLAWREALAVLLLATGPFRVLDPRWPAEVGRRARLAVRLLEQP